jgi:hypothetical protein
MVGKIWNIIQSNLPTSPNLHRVGKKYETHIKFKWSNAPNYASGFQAPTKMAIDSSLF